MNNVREDSNAVRLYFLEGLATLAQKFSFVIRFISSVGLL